MTAPPHPAEDVRVAPHAPVLGTGSAWGTEVDWRSGTLRQRTDGRPTAQWQPAPQPGTLPKRPFTFFEVMDGGFRLLRFSPGSTFGISMIVCTLLTLVSALIVAVIVMGSLGLLQRLAENPEAGLGLNLVVQTGSVAVSLLALSLVLLLSAFAAFAADRAVARERMRLSEVWRGLSGRRLRLVGLTALAFVCHLLLLGVCLLPGTLLVLVSPPAGVVLATLGVLVWTAATVWLFTKASLAGAAIAVEDLGIIAALRRSWDLTRDGFWRSTGQYVVSYLLSSQVMGLLMTPLLIIVMVGFVLIGVLLSFDSGTAAMSFLVFGLTIGMGLAVAAITIGMTALLYAYLSGVVAMVYLDRRMRREGYDLVLLRRAELEEAAARKCADALPSARQASDPAHRPPREAAV